ncbi:MAG TPA: hypothetical protein VF168_04785 [Trueperaceae bacterium]
MREADYGSSAVETWTTVQDPRQAQLLSDREAFRYFEPFMAREKSVSEAARELGCSTDTMLYRVRSFLAAGLLRIVRVEPRAGRPIKIYRSSGDAYFVPFDVTPFATLEERLAEQMEEFSREVVHSSAALLRQTGRRGQRIYRTREGRVWNDSAADPHTPFIIGDPGVPAAYDFSQVIRLQEEDARRLQLELHSLFERYAAVADELGREYLWQVTLIPKVAE